MKISAGSGDFKSINENTLAKFCTRSGYKNDPELKELNKISGGLIKKLYDTGEFVGKLNQNVVLHDVAGVKADRIILAGLGADDKLDPDCYRQAAGTISVLPAVKKSNSLGFYIDSSPGASISSAVIEGFNLGRFKVTEYKSVAEEDKIKSLNFYIKDKSKLTSVRRGLSYGEISSDGANMARSLASQPGNFLTPRKFAVEAESLAKKYKFSCRVLDEKQIRDEKMGCLLGVAQGSVEPPRFLILKYRGGGKAAPVVLVGKGITFDSGGISLKPVLNMHEMKGDMQGGAIVLSTMVAISRLKPKVNVVGLIPLAENMPSSRAAKPGDILKSRNGKTVEIISTDAEGRLILADALDYANKFRPQAVIDIATLTGAALYVLGYTAAPIMGNNAALIDAIRAASETTAEKVWELPIWDEYRRLMKSPIADLKNSGGKPAATITAGAFLENFIGDWPWAHIDIAYVDVEKDGQPYIPKGTSGIGLRLLVDLIINWKKIK